MKISFTLCLFLAARFVFGQTEGAPGKKVKIESVKETEQSPNISEHTSVPYIPPSPAYAKDSILQRQAVADQNIIGDWFMKDSKKSRGDSYFRIMSVHPDRTVTVTYESGKNYEIYWGLLGENNKRFLLYYLNENGQFEEINNWPVHKLTKKVLVMERKKPSQSPKEWSRFKKKK